MKLLKNPADVRRKICSTLKSPLISGTMIPDKVPFIAVNVGDFEPSVDETLCD